MRHAHATHTHYYSSEQFTNKLFASHAYTHTHTHTHTINPKAPHTHIEQQQQQHTHHNLHYVTWIAWIWFWLYMFAVRVCQCVCGVGTVGYNMCWPHRIEISPNPTHTCMSVVCVCVCGGVQVHWTQAHTSKIQTVAPIGGLTSGCVCVWLCWQEIIQAYGMCGGCVTGEVHIWWISRIQTNVRWCVCVCVWEAECTQPEHTQLCCFIPVTLSIF